MNTVSESDLLERLREGDQPALAELYDRAQKRGLLPTSPLLDILRV